MRKLTVVIGLLVIGLLMVMQTGSAARPLVQFGSQTEPFEVAIVRMEFNQTDNDLGVQFFVDNGEGLRELTVVGPHRRKVIDLKWQDRPRLGLSEFQTETDEPAPEITRAAYPPGVYQFFGRTVDGQKLHGQGVLSHALLAAPVITFPEDGQTVVLNNGITATWNPVAGAVRYIVEVDHEVPRGGKLEADIPATLTSFTIPEQFLVPGSDFKIGVAAVAANNNRSLSENEFETED